MTRIESFVGRLQDAAIWVEQMATSGYQDQQLRDLVARSAGQTELFLKTVVLPSVSARATLNECINALEQKGVVEADRNTLHSLRQIYNNCKHDPTYSPSLFEFQALLSNVIRVAGSLGTLNLGNTNQPEKPVYKQVFWLVAWDHFIGGDTEVHVIVPTTDGKAPTLDLVYIEMMAWDQIKTVLAGAGFVKPGQEAIPSRYYDEFAAEDDFHDAIAFQGEYRAVVAALAAHERRENLLPMLLRENDVVSMVQGFALALIDVANSNPTLGDAELASTISTHVVDSYAVPATFGKLNEYAEEFSAMLRQLSKTDREVLSGPVWTGVDSFTAAETSAVAKHPSMGILVDRARTVLLRKQP